MPLLKLLTAFDGRIGRASFWLGTALVAFCLWLTESLAARHAGAHAAQVTAFAGAFALFPWSALAAKRARDRSRPWLYGPALVIAIVLLGLGPVLLPSMPRDAPALLSLLLWLIALIDLGLLPGCLAPSSVAEPEPDAKPKE